MPWTKQLHHVEAETLNPTGPTAGTTVAVSLISAQGLSLQGLLWKVDEFIGLPAIKDKYAEPWSRVSRARNDRNVDSNETEHRMKPFPDPTDFIRRCQLAATEILFEILMSLCEKGRKDVVNVILNSTSDCTWRNPRGDACIESVDEFPEYLKVENRKGMFRLDEGPGGKFRQEWLIDRVLDQGGLWLARAMAPPLGVAARKFGPAMVERAAAAGQDTISPINSSSLRNISPFLTRTSVNAAGAFEPSLCEIDNVHSTADPRPKLISLDRGGLPQITSHSQAMFWTTLLTQKAKDPMAQHDEKREGMDADTSMQYRPALMTQNLIGVSLLGLPYAPYAVFDIDGSTSDEVLVLTPHQHVLESIPRPDIRSLSISWVVEPINEGNVTDSIEAEVTKSTADLPEFSAATPKIRAKGMVRGMWNYSYMAHGRFDIV